jgi:transcriptional regulator with XRE-family HTH domain
MLRRLRKTQGLSLDAMSARTRIQRSFIESIERDAYSDLPDVLTARRMVGKLVEVLGADAGYVLVRFDKECGACPTPHANLRLPRVRVLWRRLASWPRLSMWLLGGGLTLAVLSFIGLRAQALLGAPSLLVDSPNADMHTTASSLTIGGQTEIGVQLAVNGVPVYPDPMGRFVTLLPLRAGYNLCVVTARRRFGKTASVSRQIFFEPLALPTRSGSQEGNEGRAVP